MLVDPKILAKTAHLERTYDALRFATAADVSMEIAETRDHHRRLQDVAGLKWRPIDSGAGWGDSGVTAWLRGAFAVPSSLNGHGVFLRADTGAAESLLIVDGEHRGVFDSNHPVRLLALQGAEGRRHEIHLEAYAGHSFPGAQPFDGAGLPNDGAVEVKKNSRTFRRVEVVSERRDVSDFVFELRALHQLAQSLEENSLRRGRIVWALERVFAFAYAKPGEVDEAQWRPALAEARRVMRPLLEKRNGPTTPRYGIVGHSHIDTAWLWPVAETWRKCARTFSSVLSLMEQYPEFTFVQSAACHADAVRRLYPALFERIRARVKEGRWEINGAMWVEPDCNIPSGESLVRQALVGQRATREMFGVTSDTLWQPDVFGYSAALPQILRGCGVEFFCTTKLGWNDTNRFPYDTFVWEGIDGSTVLSHFNLIQFWPDPVTLIKEWNWVQHKDVQDRRLLAFGAGDGGGGPQCEMIEMARLLRDLEGCPRTDYTTVSAFMRGCRDELPELPRWVGELYLELHRGTLTSIAGVKRGNRRCEIALRETEFLCTLAALRGAAYPRELLLGAWKKVLLNQFHDILPGSSIAEVNDEALATFDACLADAAGLRDGALKALVGPAGDGALLVANSLSWDRIGEMELEGLPAGLRPAGAGVTVQAIQDVEGRDKLAVHGLELPALAYAFFPPARSGTQAASRFRVTDGGVETPFARVRFDASGRVVSFFDVQARRELVASGGAFNVLLLGEDVPAAWDNWDVDRDQRLKLAAQGPPASRRVVADGPLQLRIRSEHRLGGGSSLTQDMVFHATTPRVDFETVVDWREKHQFLKAGFALDVLAESARHEIQFGHVARSTHDNTSWDRAQFDVCAHKWTDVSEGGFGVAFFNDCKYACTVKGGEYRLSLIKSGRHPDARGDEGRHHFRYAMLPHAGGFAVESVVRPAYEFNIPPTVFITGAGGRPPLRLARLDTADVIVESVKWAEEGEAFVLRLYEAGKTGTHATVLFETPVRSVCETNLLEEQPRDLAVSGNAVELYFRPFEIKTLRCVAGSAATWDGP